MADLNNTLVRGNLRVTDDTNVSGSFTAGPTVIDGQGHTPLILKNGISGYSEGLRIMPYDSWSDIVLGGNDASESSGISANSWFIGNNDGNFYITRNGSSDGNKIISSANNRWTIKDTSTDRPLSIQGNNDSYVWIGYNNTSGTEVGQFGLAANDRPRVYYNSDSSYHFLAYTSDIPSVPSGSDLWNSGSTTWNVSNNVTCSGTGEWSFDCDGSSSSNMWHVWSSTNSCTILGCYPASNKVTVPSGNLEVGGSIYEGGTALSSKYVAQTSSARPGVTKLYRRDDNSGYSVQTSWTGSYWLLQGYDGNDSYHAGVQVAYADYASSAGNAAPVFANSTWYAVGDDSAIGDHDVAGTFCIKGLNGSPAINLYDSNNNYVSTVITSATIGSQSVNYANSAGGVAWSNVSNHPTDLGDFSNNAGYITSSALSGYLPLSAGSSYPLTGDLYTGGHSIYPDDFTQIYPSTMGNARVLSFKSDGGIFSLASGRKLAYLSITGLTNNTPVALNIPNANGTLGLKVYKHHVIVQIYGDTYCYEYYNDSSASSTIAGLNSMIKDCFLPCASTTTTIGVYIRGAIGGDITFFSYGRIGIDYYGTSGYVVEAIISETITAIN